jgi:hypothetical protein
MSKIFHINMHVGDTILYPLYENSGAGFLWNTESINQKIVHSRVVNLQVHGGNQYAIGSGVDFTLEIVAIAPGITECKHYQPWIGPKIKDEILRITVV